jgi:hypothetical protein
MTGYFHKFLNKSYSEGFDVYYGVYVYFDYSNNLDNIISVYLSNSVSEVYK